MPSPFPGMDPYLEHADIWPEVHLTVLVAIRAELNAPSKPDATWARELIASTKWTDD